MASIGSRRGKKYDVRTPTYGSSFGGYNPNPPPEGRDPASAGLPFNPTIPTDLAKAIAGLSSNPSGFSGHEQGALANGLGAGGLGPDPYALSADANARLGEDPNANVSAMSGRSSSGSGGGGGGGGGPLGYDLEAQMKLIADSYARQMAQLDTQRATGETEIGAADTQAKTGITRAKGDSAAQAAAAQQAIQTQYAQALQRQHGEAQVLAAELAKFGVDPTRLAPGTAMATSYLEQQQLLQDSLSKRLAEVTGAGFDSNTAASDLVSQGARGNLSNNYADMAAKIAAQRESATAQAQQEHAAAVQRQAERAAAARAAARSSSGGGDQDSLFDPLTGLPLITAGAARSLDAYGLSGFDQGSLSGLAATAAAGNKTLEDALADLEMGQYEDVDGPDGVPVRVANYNDHQKMLAREQLIANYGSNARSLAGVGNPATPQTNLDSRIRAGVEDFKRRARNPFIRRTRVG